MQTTTSEYSAFDQAYDFFNEALFAGQLPRCLITLQRKSHARGYYSPRRFISRTADGETIDEIALNPDTFADQSDSQILSTLVHEMVHLWQEKYGKPSRRSYHNREWANKMEEVGLMPSAIGQPGGRSTGQHMTHYILEDGLFARSVEQLLSTGFRLNWQSRSVSRRGRGMANNKNKVKYSCSSCGQNAWAKPAAQLVCGHCMMTMLSAL